ncbi:hypothetical protein CDAR_503591 [Caerostris darwini]|uniref:Uncharacterized protein n=1 Tax=Caerostris darwini TaxID=1538125 RepID=A0AAV4NRD4_9ARAC|nr:hypothetical protein CDAR_503591 [Caerostris darwini]
MALFRERWCPRPTPTLIAQHREKTARQWNSNKKRDQSNNGLGNKRFQWGDRGAGMGGNCKPCIPVNCNRPCPTYSTIPHPPLFFPCLVLSRPKMEFSDSKKDCQYPRLSSHLRTDTRTLQVWERNIW